MIWLGEFDWRPHSPGVIHPPPLPIAAFNLYGVYPFPTARFDEWVHEDDLGVAEMLLPSDRVFRRVAEEGLYIVLTYGPARMRVKPALCRLIAGDGLDVGDAVEVISNFGRNDPLVGVIEEMRCSWSGYSRSGATIRYSVRKGERLLASAFLAGDLQPVRLCAR